MLREGVDGLTATTGTTAAVELTGTGEGGGAGDDNVEDWDEDDDEADSSEDLQKATWTTDRQMVKR